MAEMNECKASSPRYQHINVMEALDDLVFFIWVII